jgi:DNA-binding NtrC family response regulator
MDGVEVLEKARAVQPALQTLMMTAYATVETAVDAMKIGAMDYLIKPFEPDDPDPQGGGRVCGLQKPDTANER